jgi:hypothetical protein
MKKIPMLEKFAAQSLVESDGELIFSKEKFAELIVKECMACSIWVGKNNTNTVEPIHTAQAINQRIKQQFGVEE